MKKSLVIILLSMAFLSLPVIMKYHQFECDLTIDLFDSNTENSELSDKNDNEETEEINMSSILSKILPLKSKSEFLHKIFEIINPSREVDSPPPRQ
ncbi:hypothetical protein ACT3CE_14425 [Marinifilum sp. RC60d5]|uniref:hypothetical protein n=1 Tax=Marinifilum sp. RC60d5 TaxID=3458414 RepID=UPI00403689EE